ncbi:hypothetical protein HZC07_05080 [Candidatus Micrarchaeota archaeon]|nr:hypothetical protein [Candidatus Micrarchaeota archaeon]
MSTLAPKPMGLKELARNGAPVFTKIPVERRVLFDLTSSIESGASSPISDGCIAVYKGPDAFGGMAFSIIHTISASYQEGVVLDLTRGGSSYFITDEGYRVKLAVEDSKVVAVLSPEGLSVPSFVCHELKHSPHLPGESIRVLAWSDTATPFEDRTMDLPGGYQLSEVRLFQPDSGVRAYTIEKGEYKRTFQLASGYCEYVSLPGTPVPGGTTAVVRSRLQITQIELYAP